jgi:hypothetical protein
MGEVDAGVLPVGADDEAVLFLLDLPQGQGPHRQVLQRERALGLLRCGPRQPLFPVAELHRISRTLSSS